MKTKRLNLFVIACILVVGSMALAEVTVPKIFGDNMVLQRELPVPVWGSASPDEKVTVMFNGQKLSTVADSQGKWMVKLKPLKTSKTEKTLTVKGTNTITFNGIVVGEVWLCSGQSNMADSFNRLKRVALLKRSISKKIFPGLEFAA